MARRKSPFSGFTRMPSLPDMEPFPKRRTRSTRRNRDDDDDDDYIDDPGDRPITKAEYIAIQEEERERAYYNSPEGIAERKQKADQDKFFWDLMIGIWVIRPYEMMKYIFNRLFKRRYNSIGIGHFISVTIWIVILWIILELYLNREQNLIINEYIITRLLVFGGIITATYLYCKILAWWKFR